MEKSKLALIAGTLILVGTSGCKTFHPYYYDSTPVRRRELREGYCGPFSNGNYISNSHNFHSPSINARSYHRSRK
jgi:hypothetical protein